MGRLKGILNYIGLGLIILSGFALKIWPYKKIYALILASIGLALLISYLVFNLAKLKENLKRKSFLYSGNLIIIVILVFAILVLLNYLFSRHHYRFDFTEGKIHSLSDQSIKVLKNLKEDIHIKAFFREGGFQRSKMEDLLKIYAYHSKKIKYEFIDPDKNPGLVKRYDILQDGTTVFECGDKDTRITTTSEEDITNSIIKISRKKKKIIYFLEGHGEKSIEDESKNGYSHVKSELQKLGYEVKKIVLALEDNFKDDISLLIIPGIKKDLLPQELETIDNYIKKGGRVFFMVDPENSPVITTYLKKYGIKLEKDLVVDTVSRVLGGDYFMPVVSNYESHPITEKFRYATFFPLARSVDKVESSPEGISVKVIAKTSPNSWAERNLEQKEITFNPNEDRQGPIPVAGVATIKQKSENRKQKTEKQEKEGRIAVFGDSDFVSNNYYHLSGNGNLFLNTVNWLTEEADLISIQSKTTSPRTIQLTPVQGRLIFFTSVIILPLLILITGISIWVRRRAK
ncbi:MAG: GldG family protein [Candidatus Aminicenantia bacterium]